MNYQFTLEKYAGKNSRHTCPNCNKPHKFTRYINTQTGEHVANHVGRCDSEVKCGYHYTPKQYFEDNNVIASSGATWPSRNNTQLDKTASHNVHSNERGHTVQELYNTLTDYDSNHLIQFLAGKLGVQATEQLITKYRIGTHHKWRGSTVFWYTNTAGNITAGKIMLYDSHTGKRIKTPQPHISWMHSELGKQDFKKQPCLFGEHLLQNNIQPVGIVESEKTALIAAHYHPQYIWLATGGIGNLNVEHINRFNRRVTLFPDVGGYDTWAQKAKFLAHSTTSNMLQHLLHFGDRYNGFDLGDLLLQTG